MGSGPSTAKKRKKKFTVSQVPPSGDQPVSFDDFQILRAIGKGSFGKVCIVQKKDTKKMYAMKYMNKTQCVEKDVFKNVLREIEILVQLEHPFLVNMWFTFQDEEDMFMVVDLLLGGDLRYHLQGGVCFDESRVTLYICELALALDYLSSKRIIHRDIKPDNILLDDAGHAHITDFNIATFVGESEVITSVSGTRPYMAPEVMLCAQDHSQGYSFSADWWSLGVTIYEMVCRVRPYDIHSSTHVQDMHKLIHGTCLHFPKCVNKHLTDLILQLLSVDPEQRLSSVSELRQHPYLRNVDFDAISNRQVVPSFVPNRNQLNCDPTFELEEMIIESKPLHKKKKRLSKKNKARCGTSSKDAEAMQEKLNSIQEKFVVYDRERELKRKAMEERERQWEEEMRKVIS